MDSFSLEHCAQIPAPAPPIYRPTGTLDLRLADCMDVMREFPDKHFDLAIVDPPYGIKADNTRIASGGFYSTWTTKNKYPVKDWDSKRPEPEFFAELQRVSVAQIVWGGNFFADILPVGGHWIVWDKENTMPTFSDAELAWTSFARKSVKTFKFCWNGLMASESGRIHPTQKPVALYRWLLENYAKPDHRILDTHLGSGSHAIACHYAGMHLTACEIDADYFRDACARIARETAQMTLTPQ
jgi:site-specific DNA-methyltransferase (adenine-specific)